MRYSMDTTVPPDVEKLSVKFRKGLYQYVNSTSKRKLTEKQTKDLNTSLKVFMYNCIIATVGGKGSFAISLKPSTYSSPAIRNGVSLRSKLSYTYTKKVLEYFSDNNFIELEKGYVKDWNSKKVRGKWVHDPEFVPSIVYLKHNLKNLVLSLEIGLDTFKQINCMILRGSDKTDKSYKKTKRIQEEIGMLEDFNVRALETVVTKGGSNDTYIIQLRKIYNEDFETGGRLYDLCIQSMPKHERQKLIIEGESVKLLDYKSFETSIAYTLCDADMKGDPYQIQFEGYDHTLVRKVCKLIMTRLFYVDNRKTLTYLVNEHIRENFDLDKLVSDGKIPEKRIPVGQFVEILLDKHDLIEDYFYNQGEYNLQYVGSQIMDYVIEKVMQNHNKTVIPVFDEVICGKSIASSVEQYMYDAYEAVLECSDNCKVEID